MKRFFAPILALSLGLLISVLIAEVSALMLLRQTTDRWNSPASISEQFENAQPIRRDSHLASQSNPRTLWNDDVLHPYLGFVAEPRDDESIDSVSNALGFPGNQESILQPDGDDLIIGIFGGSVARGFAGLQGDRVAGAVAALLGSEDRRVRVLSLAQSGYKQPQQLMTLNYILALGGRFDLILNLDGFNEVVLPSAELEELGVFVAYPRSWSIRTESLRQDLRQAIGLSQFQKTRRQRWWDLFDRLPRHSYFLHWVWRTGDSRIASQLELTTRTFLTTKRRVRDYQSHGPQLTGDSRSTLEQAISVWYESSLQMHRLCEANGIQYLHFLQPNQYDIDSKPLSSWEKQNAWRSDHSYRVFAEEGYPRLRETGRRLVEAGVAFEDLSRLFNESEETRYQDDCCHLNRRGNQDLGDSVVAVVTERFRPRL